MTLKITSSGASFPRIPGRGSINLPALPSIQNKDLKPVVKATPNK